MSRTLRMYGAIRLVSFDAFATLLKPKAPVSDQYVEVFKPYFIVRHEDVKESLRTAINDLRAEKPLYGHDEGVTGWWGEVVRRTAIGAGAPPKVVEESLSVIVPKLMRRFSSKEGYELYDDALPALHQLRDMGVGTGLTSGGDNRIRAVLKDLGVLGLLNPCVISEEVGVDKSDLRIWTEFMQRTQGIKFQEVLHVGDELDMDYHGALRAGLNAVLLRRQGDLGAAEWRKDGEELEGVEVVKGLDKVVELVRRRNDVEP